MGIKNNAFSGSMVEVQDERVDVEELGKGFLCYKNNNNYGFNY